MGTSRNTLATLRVEGLDCGDCAARLEKAVSRLEGVAQVTVGYPAGSMRLEYDPKAVDLETVSALAARLGYTLSGHAGFRSEYDHHDELGHCDHDHGDQQGHVHDRVDISDGHEHEHETGVFPVAAGAVALAAGFVLNRMGVTWYWAVYTIGAVLAGLPVARAGIRMLLAGGGADINLLTAVAGVGALALGEWAEAAAVLTLFSVGEYLEERASDRARSSIRELMDLSPSTARVKRGGEVLIVPADEVHVGEVVVVLPGDRIPVDGTVEKGESSVNQASITGESVPVDKGPGDDVYAGTMNEEGALEILSSRTADDTTISRIVSMVEDAQSKKAKSQRMVDAFAKYWTPAMMGLSAVIGFLVPLVSGAPYRPWIYRGLTVLIVSCPCSLVISTPVTVVAAIARAAKRGVLIKGGIHLEDLGRVKVVGFDKTGTLTAGKISVDQVVATGGTSEEEVLRLAASVEARSEHPLAKAVLNEVASRQIAFLPGEQFSSIKGKGAKAEVEEANVYVGNAALMGEAEIQISDEMLALAASARAMGQTVVYVGRSGRLLGLIGLSDQVRQESVAAIQQLTGMGLAVTMLTGDEEATARAVASKMGLKSYSAALLPEDKQTAISSLREKHGRVAMVGDGVNDAPSLAAADVGIAMGHGADVALETADVALLTNDVGKVAWSIGLGRESRTLIVQNVLFSVFLKIAAIAMVLFGALPLWLAVLADSGAAVAVTFNGLRILRFR